MKNTLFTFFFLAFVFCGGATLSAHAQTNSAPTPQTGVVSSNSTGQTASTPSASTGNAASNFVSLTSIPQIQNLTASGDLPSFFNELYKICIGIAAAIAFLKIIQAGIMYMGGDSITEVSHAKSMIVSAVLGLVLVLSPAIVFGILNPSILSLQIGGTDGLKSLAPSNTTSTAVINPQNSVTSGDGSCYQSCGTGTICKAGQCVANAGSCSAPIANGASIPPGQEACCKAQKGCDTKMIPLPVGTFSATSPQYTCQCGN